MCTYVHICVIKDGFPFSSFDFNTPRSLPWAWNLQVSAVTVVRLNKHQNKAQAGREGAKNQ